MTGWTIYPLVNVEPAIKFILSLLLCVSPLSSYILFLDLVAVVFDGCLFLECSFLIPRTPEYFPKVSLRNRSLPQSVMSFCVSRSIGHPFIWSFFEVVCSLEHPFLLSSDLDSGCLPQCLPLPSSTGITYMRMLHVDYLM